MTVLAGRAPRSAGSTRDLIWNACADKSCCRTTRVHVTGADLARLVGALELPAATIVTAVPLTRGEYGFWLWPGGRGWELALRKNGAIGPTGAPCVFLVETNDGYAVCGAGDLRPTSCRAFPAAAGGPRDGARDASGEDTAAHGVRVLTGSCHCHAWSAADLGHAEWTSALAAATEEAADREAIEAWNRQVLASGRRHSPVEFCDHLLSRQDSA